MNDCGERRNEPVKAKVMLQKKLPTVGMPGGMGRSFEGSRVITLTIVTGKEPTRRGSDGTQPAEFVLGILL